jgi:nucleoside-diphosphate-sugar epimerase
MNIFLTGASGYIGGSVAMGLLAAGHSVRGLTRGPASADRLRASGIEPVIGTLDDADLLSREARASDGAVNTASADHEGAVRALMSGLDGSGKPLLHTSGSSVVGDDARGDRATDQVFDEDTPFIVSPSKQARRALDLVVLGARDKGIRSAVICPTLIYGVGRGLNTQSVQIPFLVSNALEQGVVQIVGSGRNVWSNVHIDDVVALYLLVLEKTEAGQFYFAENGEASFQAIAAAISERLGLGQTEGLPAAVAAERWGEVKAYYTFGSNSRVRAKRARELGWRPEHASMIDWILTEMPVDRSPGAPARPNVQS